jgi:hypothetical protein
MSTAPAAHPQGKHRYTSVVEGIALANDFTRSRLPMSEFARQRGVSFNMVKYWSTRARQLAAASGPALVEVATMSATGVIEPSRPALPASPSPAPAVSPMSSATSIEVRLPNGVRIGVAAGFSAEVLSQVIACVSGRPC